MTDALGAWFAPGLCTKRTPAKTVIIEIIIIIIIVNTFLYGAFTKLNAPYNYLQTEDKITIPMMLTKIEKLS